MPLPTLDEIMELWEATDRCLAQGLTASRRAMRYAESNRLAAARFQAQAARTDFPEIRARLLRIADRLTKLAEYYACSRKTLPDSRQDRPVLASEPTSPIAADDALAMVLRHVAEADTRVFRQELLVTKVSAEPRLTALQPAALKFLDTLKTSRRLAREHLALELERQSARTAASATSSQG